MKRYLKKAILGISVLGLIVGFVVGMAAPAQADSTLCTGSSFSTCINAGYITHDYENHYTNSYWRAISGHNCTNYVGYMLTRNGDSGHGVLMGDAGSWDNTISANPAWGYIMNGTPAVGSIAQWDPYANQYIGASGHVAYVESVNSNGSITISEDNYPSGPFRWRTISGGSSYWPTRFLHIKDLVTSPPAPPLPSAITSAQNANGEISVFGIGSDGSVYYKQQVAPNDSFGNTWSEIYADAKDITAISNADGRIELLYVKSDGSVWGIAQTTPNGAFGTQYTLGGNVVSIASARNADGRITVFVTGTDNHIYTRTQIAPNDSFDSSWSEILADAKDSTATSNADGRIELVYISSDGSVKGRAQVVPNGTFGSEYSLGGNVSRVTSSSNADGRIGIFVTGTDGNIYYKQQMAVNSTFDEVWSEIPAGTKDITAVQNADGRIELMYVGNNSSIWGHAQVMPNGAFGSEYTIGGVFR